MRKIIAFLLVITILTSFSAFAQPDISAPSDNGVITVEYQTTGKNHVHLQVLKKDKTINDLLNCAPEKIDSVIEFEKTVEALDNGIAQFKFKINSDSGKYIFRINAFGKGAEDIEYDYISPSVKKDVVKNVILATKVSEVISALEGNFETMGILDELLTDETDDAFYLDLLDYQDFDKEKPSEFTNYCNLKLVMLALEKGTLNNPLLYDGILKLSTQVAYSTYSSLDSNLQNEINSVFKDKKFNTVNDVQDLFNEKTILVAVKNIEYWNKLYGLLLLNNSYLKMDFTQYDKVKDKYPVDSNVANKTFLTTEAMKKEFNNRVDAALLNESGKQNNSSTSSSGGGSKGSGGGFVIKNDTYAQLEDNKNNSGTMSDVDIFSDIENVSWAKPSINYLHLKGIISGVGDGKFAPQKSILREEFAKMIVGALGVYDENAMSEFDDSQFSDWHYSYISSAYYANLMNGVSNYEFGVGKVVTRQDFALVCARALNLKDCISTFNDNESISDYAKGAVGAMQNLGIMQGDGDNIFRPNDPVTRAEAAKVIKMVMDAKEEK